MKSKKLEKFQSDWNEISKIKIFEVEVINRITNNHDYVCFDVELHGRTFVAYHVPFNKKETKSKKVANCKHVCDIDFSIDKNLEALFDVCISALISSSCSYFELI